MSLPSAYSLLQRMAHPLNWPAVLAAPRAPCRNPWLEFVAAPAHQSVCLSKSATAERSACARMPENKIATKALSMQALIIFSLAKAEYCAAS